MCFNRNKSSMSVPDSLCLCCQLVSTDIPLEDVQPVTRDRSNSFPSRAHSMPNMTTKIVGYRKTSDFRDEFRKGVPESTSVLKTLFTCNKKRATNCMLSVFPVYRIMRKYEWKTGLLADLICGITVGIMQLPQGQANTHIQRLTIHTISLI